MVIFVRENEAPGYHMGPGILGMAFPYHDSSIVLENLNPGAKDRVREHEKTHLEHPSWSESKVRYLTGTQEPGRIQYIL